MHEEKTRPKMKSSKQIALRVGNIVWLTLVAIIMDERIYTVEAVSDLPLSFVCVSQLHRTVAKKVKEEECLKRNAIPYFKTHRLSC